MAHQGLRGALPILILLALGLRLAAAFYLPARMDWPDGQRYERIARELTTGQGYGREKDPPLHPLALTAVYAVFGESVRAARIIWALLGTGTCLLCYFIAAGIFGRREGVLAMGVAAVYPLTLYLGVLPEYPQGLFSVLLMGSVLLAIRYAANPASWGRVFGLGLVLGLAILTIPTALLLLAMLLPWMLAARGLPLRGRVARAAAVTAICVVTVGAWTLWHWSSTGIFFVISANGGQNFYKGNCELIAKYGDADMEDVLPTTHSSEMDPVYARYLAVVEEARKISDLSQRDRFFYGKGLAFIRRHPGATLRLAGEKFLAYWAPFPRLIQDRVNEQGAVNARNIVTAATYLPVLLLAFAGVFVLWQQRGGLIPLYLAIASQALAYTIVHSSVRYRSPIDYLLIVLACATVCRLWPGQPDRAAYCGTERESRGSEPAVTSSVSE
ncbi:MAG: glycosyltransferase family 39 protein [Phycisphaerae bacterium]|nr:glycosyltransferase family 39 protein [Phycisphaerae bacterium]